MLGGRQHEEKGPMANSDTQELAEQCLKDAGAIVLCESCRDYYVDELDPDAESRAYAIATNEWKAESRGFRGMEREEVVTTIKSALRSTNTKCPGCEI
jgi:hypothetical protein